MNNFKFGRKQKLDVSNHLIYPETDEDLMYIRTQLSKALMIPKSYLDNMGVEPLFSNSYVRKIYFKIFGILIFF